MRFGRSRTLPSEETLSLIPYRNLKENQVTPHGSNLMTNQRKGLVTLTQFEEVMIQI